MGIRNRFTQLRAALLALAAGLCVAPMASAQTYTVTVASGGIPFGNIASAASGATVFYGDPASGCVTRHSGSGDRVTTNCSARVLVTIACGNTNNCNTTQPYVRVGTTGSPTRRLDEVYAFFASNSGGTASILSQSGLKPLNLRLGPIGKNSTKTFYVTAAIGVSGDDSGDLTGAASQSFYVGANASSYPSSGTSRTVTATVFRRLAMAKTSDLSFGRIVRPLSGAATVAVNAVTGVRTVGTAVALATPNPTRATYAVTGEPNKVVSISAPNFTMLNANGDSVAVTATKSITNLSLGSSGSNTFGVGGSFPLSSTQAGGSYAGSFTVTVNYN